MTLPPTTYTGTVCSFNAPLGLCRCGRPIGTIGEQIRGGVIVCWACAVAAGAVKVKKK